MTKVSVIIPYYQRDAGILRRALTSVLAQEVAADVQVEVIVVDDGSPMSPEGEIDGLVFAPPFHLNLIKQPNGGVAAARNTGLRAVSEDTTYIAFLDSDDIWNPQHLLTALAVLDQGYDFYFCNGQRVQLTAPFFIKENFIEAYAKDIKKIGSEVYEIGCDALFDATLGLFPARLSTSVFRATQAAGIFFNDKLWAAGEDQLFILALTTRGGRYAFAAAINVMCGEGLNVFFNRRGWNDEAFLTRNMESLLAFYEFQKFDCLNKRQKADIKKNIRHVRLLFAFLTLRHVLKRRKAWPQGLRERTKQDPTFWRWYVTSVLLSVVLYPVGYFK